MREESVLAEGPACEVARGDSVGEQGARADTERGGTAWLESRQARPGLPLLPGVAGCLRSCSVRQE